MRVRIRPRRVPDYPVPRPGPGLSLHREWERYAGLPEDMHSSVECKMFDK